MENNKHEYLSGFFNYEKSKNFKEFLQKNVEIHGCTVFRYYDDSDTLIYAMAVRNKSANGDDFFIINGKFWYDYASDWEKYEWKVLWRYDGSE